jgi:hypothetical protein
VSRGSTVQTLARHRNEEVEMWRITATVAAAVAVAFGFAAAADGEAPSTAAAQHVCESAGGTFLLDGPSYACIGLPSLTTGQEHSATAVCENAYGGTFLIRPSGYICVIT